MKTGKRLLCSTLAISLGLLAGCAKNPTSPNDPLEAYNRVIFAFNQDIDHLAVRPIAKVYDTITPSPLKKGVTNFYANLNELITFPNDILQANFKYAGLDIFRFLINSTVGIGGLFDVAARMGMPKPVETFGLPFAKWRGGKTSKYFILPLLGPSTIQNGIGLAAGLAATPWTYLDDSDDAWSYSAWGLQIINYRARLLPTDKMVETAFDPYIFVRDAYMQTDRREIENNQKYGDPKRENGHKTYLTPSDDDADVDADTTDTTTNDTKKRVITHSL